jgi:uncharacterized coiled-coil protein SlyX
VNEDELTERLTRAEATIAHLERDYEVLNQVVIDQGKIIGRLQKQIERLEGTVEAQELERVRGNNPKPPHYSP